MDVSLSAQHIVKRYGGVVALADGNLNVASGEVVALLGANGSGKSTLSKIITGVVSPNEGSLLIDGRPTTLSSPQIAKKLGITAVYQELSLIPDMTVSENIWLTHEPLRGKSLIKNREVRARTQELLNLFSGTFKSLAPDIPVKMLPPDERQIVEILKALSTQPRLIILDEATASLDTQQVNRLFDLVADWKSRGMAIVFVSHRMEEIFRVADRATVLRSGRSVGDIPMSDATRESLVELMIEGASTPRNIAIDSVKSDAPVRLSVEKLTTSVLKNIAFELRDGELLGLGGLHGQGQSDLLLTLFGDIPHTGKIILSQKPVNFTHPRQAMDNQVAFVPGDRATEGLLLIRSILENLQLPSWANFGTPLNINRARAESQNTAQSLNVVMASLDAPVSSLSGGNAQKIVIGKWMSRNPKLLLLNDPTKGVDVGAKGEFYNLLAQLQQQGTAILFYSSDDDELLGLCNRVLVLHDGEITAELSGGDLTHANLVSASMGTQQENNV